MAQLGVEVIELMPLAAFEGIRGWGYDVVDFLAVQTSYGGPATLADFVAQAHRLGMAVCLDAVFNHAGSRGCYLEPFAPYFSAESTPWGQVFACESPDDEPCRFISEATRWWFEAFGIDALRLDAIHAIPAAARSVLVPQLHQVACEVTAQTGWKRSLIAESDLNDDSLLEQLGLDGLWNDDFHHAIHSLFTGETHGYYADFAARSSLEKVYRDTYFHNGTYSSFREKQWGKPVEASRNQEHFVVFASNHDQVGNRVWGERPAALISETSAAAQAALVLLSPFTPLLFMGEEFGATTPFLFFCDPLDEDAAQAVRKGRLEEFHQIWANEDKAGDKAGSEPAGSPQLPPDPTAEKSLVDSQLDWQQIQSRRGQKFLHWYQDLIALRKTREPGESRARLHWTGDLLCVSYRGLSVWVNFAAKLQHLDNVLLEWEQTPENSATASQTTATTVLPPAGTVSQVWVTRDKPAGD